MTIHILPPVGDVVFYGGANVTVTEVKKRGRGYQVFYRSQDGTIQHARLRDFNGNAEAPRSES